MDLPGFQAYLKDTKNTICGRFPIQLFLATLAECGLINFKSQEVKYTQSGHVKDNNDSSVSYASIIVSTNSTSMLYGHLQTNSSHVNDQ